MDDYDLAIVGRGPAPGLLFLTLADNVPDLKMILLSEDSEVGGRYFELVLLDRLPATMLARLDPMLVREWRGYRIVRDGQRKFFNERVGLLDTAQLWLELLEQVGDGAIVASCGNVSFDGTQASWCHSRAKVGDLVDLRILPPPARQSNLVQANFLADLECPVLADFDVGGTFCKYLQYVPLGLGLTLIHCIGVEGHYRFDDSIEDKLDFRCLDTVSYVDNIASMFCF
jgi:hypothetical protein